VRLAAHVDHVDVPHGVDVAQRRVAFGHFRPKF
jgi:hypothetical protein